jgi:hypothetical protein
LVRKWLFHWTKPKALARQLRRPPWIEPLEQRIVPGFINAGSYQVDRAPTSVAVGDFNGDGIPDLATANDNLNGTVSVLLGNGDGTFQPAVNYPAGPGANAITAGDFNGDGTLDLAVAYTGNYVGDPAGVSILLGNGDGTFRLVGQYDVGVALGVSVGDFNGDGNLDVVAATRSGVSVLLGNGDGSFQQAIDYTIGHEGTSEIATGDFNGDGITDLAAAVYGENAVTMLLGNGDGTFAIGESDMVGHADSVAAADFNGDSKVDLVTANYDSGTDSVLLGNGDGTFQPAVNYVAGVQRPLEVRVADFDGDGAADIVTVGPQNVFGTLYTVSVLLGNGDGTLQPPQNDKTTNNFSVATADLTGNGRQDLVLVNDVGSEVTIFLNDGSWTAPTHGEGKARLTPDPALPAASSRTDSPEAPAKLSDATDQILASISARQQEDSHDAGIAVPFNKGAPQAPNWHLLETAVLLGLDDSWLSE